MLLSLYDFVLANKQFCIELAIVARESQEPRSAMASLLSFCSYLYQHAHRSTRTTLYAHLTLFIIRILVEDAVVAKRLCETSCPVRLCRQRLPYLPTAKTERTLAASLLDVMVDSINHNLRKKLDVDLYM